MEASSGPLTNNHHYLKACILYEVLQKKPIFDSYRNFCSTVGQDAMEYPDFEYWYYRFYHGQMDFDYDRRADPEPKTLVDIPVVSMKKIAESLDAIERTHLRTMNHAIKDVADSFSPVFEKIEVKLSEKDLSWSWNDRNYSCHKKGRGYSLCRPDNSIVENSNECYIKKGLEYLIPVLKMPNIQVNHFSLHFDEETFDPNGLLAFPFNAKNIFIYGLKINQVIQPLSAMNPGHLESISIDGMLHTETYPVNLDMIRETDQFKQAKSVEMKEIMKRIPEFLKNNDHYLKSCILYEVALKKPIFDSYRSFCDAVGKDAMQYPDFEFWYKRFCTGELDFDYDRSMDPVPKALMDMPVKLMEKITENLDTVERSSLRSVNRAIKDVADSLPSVFESISISWNYYNGLKWKFNDNPATHSGNGKLEKLSNIPGFKVNNLLLRTDDVRSDDGSKRGNIFEAALDRIRTELSDVLPVSFLTAKNVDISARTINEATQLLSIVNPGNLESIRLWPVKEDNFSEFFHTEQFKNAKNVEIMSLKGFGVQILSNFSHLKSFKIKLSGDFLEEDFWRIRETISTFENLEKCELRIVDSENQLEIRTVAEAIGAVVPEEPLKTITHRYQIPESNKCLEFKIEGGGPHILMKIVDFIFFLL
ncbi:unnamed protein product [Caenorhabditis nigoni]